MSNMRRGETRLWDSRRVEPCPEEEQQQTGHCWASAHTGRMSDLHINLSLWLCLHLPTCICVHVCVCRFQFQFENISSYLALAISRDLLTFAIAILINWKWKLIFIIWLIAMPKNVIDCKMWKTGKTRSQFMNYTTRFAFICLPPPSLTSLTAFNCIQVGRGDGSKIYGCRPLGQEHAKRRHKLHAQRQLVQNLCSWRRALIAVTLQQWSHSSSALWLSKR